MKTGILIDPKLKTVTRVQLEGTAQEISNIIGCEIISAACIFENEDTVYIDDEGLYKEELNFFMLKDYPQPISGRALILGTNEGGESVSAKSQGINIAWLTKADLKAIALEQKRWAESANQQEGMFAITIGDIIGSRLEDDEDDLTGESK